MEFSEVVNTQYAVPVGFVLICAVLVFAFGFKSAEQPEFAQLKYTSDDRKPAGKKRKVKDKKTQSNGHITPSSDEESKEPKQKSGDLKQKPADSPAARKQKPADSPAARKQDSKKKEVNDENRKKEQAENKESKQLKSRGKENLPPEEVKNKKNLAKQQAKEEKPADFDEGEWEQAVSRKDKKNKKISDDTGSKKDTPKKKKTPKSVTDSPSKDKAAADVKKEDADVKKEAADVKKEAADVKKEDAETPKIKEETKEKEPADTKDESSKTVPDKVAVDKTQNVVIDKSKEKKVEPLPVEIEEDDYDEIRLFEKRTEDSRSKKRGKKKQVPGKSVPEPLDPADALMSTLTNDAASSPLAFDELGDVWKEAKVTKKSKKKVRKDQ